MGNLQRSILPSGFHHSLLVFGLIATVLLLASIAFVPIVALLIWRIVTAVALMRSRVIGAPRAGVPVTGAASGS